MTAASPETHGNLTVPNDVGAWEFMSGVGQSDTMLSFTQESIWTLPAVTMPWAGQMTAVIIHTGYTTDWGLIAIEAWLDQSIPAPANHYAGTFYHAGETAAYWEQVYSMAQWRDLSANVTITPKLRVRHALGAINWRQNAYVYNYRVLRV